MDGLISIALGLLAVLAYLLPCGVAIHREHPARAGIALVNVLFGWTLIGWLVSFVWAFTGEGEAGKRSCPHCAESIQAAAAVCRYCGRDV